MTDDMLRQAGMLSNVTPKLTFQCCNKKFQLAHVVNFLIEKNFTGTSVDKGVCSHLLASEADRRLP